VSLLSETGAFGRVCLLALRATDGRPWPLTAALCAVTAVVSAFLDNVTTVLLMAPVVIRLCEALHLDPIKVLLANVVLSNVGGAATAVGDPPNVLIASDPAMQKAGVNFASFATHVGPCALIVALIALAQLRASFGSDLRDGSAPVGFCCGRRRTDAEKRAAVEGDTRMTALRQELQVWRRTAQTMVVVTREEALVHGAVLSKAEDVQRRIRETENEWEKKSDERNEGKCNPFLLGSGVQADLSLPLLEVY